MAAERVLVRALELVEQGWTRNAPARDAWLQPVNVMDESATHFCAQGACYRAAREMYPDAWGTAFGAAVAALREQVGVPSLPYWQDTPERTLGEVRETFRRAIAESTPMLKKETA